MERRDSPIRPDWERAVESQGFVFHSPDDQPYWDESVCYRFTSQEIDLIEKATYALDEMCLTAIEYVVQEKLFDDFQIPPPFIRYVLDSWEQDELTIYGRFDLAFDGSGPPKLLEYNADTPTALLEAAAIQWFWYKDVHGMLDQFNSIHERLIEAWQTARGLVREPVYFTCTAEAVEDFMTVTYLRDTAMQAGLQTEFVDIEAIGWDPSSRAFVDAKERPIGSIFKLYPWEWLIREESGGHLRECTTKWLEAPWKMFLSNKAILPILWHLFPESPYLLEAAYEPLDGDYVRKPLLAREGANIEVVQGGRTVLATEGAYSGPCVFQRLHPVRPFGGQYPVIGSWIVNGYACGIGIREDATPITRNTSRFVPHVFVH